MWRTPPGGDRHGCGSSPDGTRPSPVVSCRWLIRWGGSVAAPVAWQEADRAATDVADHDRCRRRAVHDLDLARVVEQLVEAGPADDAAGDLVTGHGAQALLESPAFAELGLPALSEPLEVSRFDELSAPDDDSDEPSDDGLDPDDEVVVRVARVSVT